jgi:NAD(P)-dependent dehydrogenase (short-subunit alcohol dehydrogenase family)
MMAGRSEGRRAVVTGASRSIGAGIAERLAAEGADVALVARTLEAHDQLPGSLRQTQAVCEKYATRIGTVVADLADEDARARVIPEAVEALGGTVDILVTTPWRESRFQSPTSPRTSSELPLTAM